MNTTTLSRPVISNQWPVATQGRLQPKVLCSPVWAFAVVSVQNDNFSLFWYS